MYEKPSLVPFRKQATAGPSVWGQSCGLLILCAGILRGSEEIKLEKCVLHFILF
jgi:hypothetical protein